MKTEMLARDAVAIRWPASTLRKIVEVDDLHIAPFNEDGVTPGTPTWIWSVAVEGELCVRGYNGQASRWYQAARRQKAGQITAAGATRDVVFEPVDEVINSPIDDAYKAKYRGNPFLAFMIAEGPRSATIKIAPRDGAKARRTS